MALLRLHRTQLDDDDAPQPTPLLLSAEVIHHVEPLDGGGCRVLTTGGISFDVSESCEQIGQAVGVLPLPRTPGAR